MNTTQATTDSPVTTGETKKPVGRKPQDFTFPMDEVFTINILKAQFKKSVPFFMKRIKALGPQIQVVGHLKAGKGRPQTQYKFVPTVAH